MKKSDTSNPGVTDAQSKGVRDDEKREKILSDTIIQSIPGVFYVLDEKAIFVRWNDYLRDEIMGKSDAEAAQMNALEVIYPEDLQLIESKIENVLMKGIDETAEARLLMRGGPEYRWFLLTGRQMVIDGKPFLVGLGVDVTERKKIEDALKEKMDEIEKMNKYMIGRELKMTELKKQISDLQRNKIDDSLK